MKLIDAWWEKRNLGVETKELICEKTYALEEVEKTINELCAAYLVVKVPSSRSDLTRCIQMAGFSYIEDLIGVTHDLHDVKRSSLHQRLYDATSYRKMGKEDIEQLLEEIEKGMFNSDRISNDSLFEEGRAAERYVNWTKDLLSKGALPYVILYKEEPAGFIILKTQDQISYTSVLGGGYEKFRRSGLGVIQKEQEIVKKLGGKSVETQVSSNNPAQLKALVLNGYIPQNIEHVFVKHMSV